VVKYYQTVQSYFVVVVVVAAAAAAAVVVVVAAAVVLMMMMTIQWKSTGTNMAYNEKSVYNDMLTMYYNFHMLYTVELFGNVECLSVNSSDIMSDLKVIVYI
jgi:ABC-type transport system involved in cytochrome bd biosynthesis fused ATPase/permease subunit